MFSKHKIIKKQTLRKNEKTNVSLFTDNADVLNASSPQDKWLAEERNALIFWAHQYCFANEKTVDEIEEM